MIRHGTGTNVCILNLEIYKFIFLNDDINIFIGLCPDKIQMCKYGHKHAKDIQYI